MGWLDDTMLKMGGKFFEIRKFLKCAHVHVAREGVVMFKRMWGVELGWGMIQFHSEILYKPRRFKCFNHKHSYMYYTVICRNISPSL